MKIKRNTNIEILRIISMLLILTSHYYLNGIIPFLHIVTGNKIIANCGLLGDLGVVIFILISGYFYKSNFKIDKFLELIIQVCFYSITIYLMMIFLDIYDFSFKNMIFNFFPTIFQKYWFITAYIIIYLLAPFFKLFIEKIDRRQFKIFLIVTSTIWLILPFFLDIFTDIKILFSNELTDLIVIYFIGAYLGKYSDNVFTQNYKKLKWWILLSIICFITSVVFLNILSVNYNFLFYHTHRLLIRQSPLTIFIGISLLILFSCKKPVSNQFINKIAACTLGVYLIHENEYIRSILWIDVLKANCFANSKIMIIHQLFSILLIYIICVIIEYFRQLIFNKFILKKLNLLNKKFEKYKFKNKGDILC